jgi:hypothetical protein
VRTIQELPGHKDVTTTMIYTHVLNRGPAAVRSTANGRDAALRPSLLFTVALRTILIASKPHHVAGASGFRSRYHNRSGSWMIRQHSVRSRRTAPPRCQNARLAPLISKFGRLGLR